MSKYTLQLLRTIGMKTFMEYIRDFAYDTPTDVITGMMHKRGYSSNSIATKVSIGRKIFFEGLLYEALMIIANARNVDDYTRILARNELEAFK